MLRFRNRVQYDLPPPPAITARVFWPSHPDDKAGGILQGRLTGDLGFIERRPSGEYQFVYLGNVTSRFVLAAVVMPARRAVRLLSDRIESSQSGTRSIR